MSMTLSYQKFLYELFGVHKFIVIVLLFFGIKASAQQFNASSGIELKTHYSFMLPHHEHMLIMNERHFPIIQLSAFKTGNSGKIWQTLYKNPQYGITFTFSGLSSPQYLGNGFSLMPFMNFPIFKKKAFSCNFFVATGVGYLTKKFDPTENYKNQAIGSHFNAAIMGQLDFRYRINESSEITAGFSLSHFSNGKITTPNLGINNVGFFTGYAFHFISNKTENNTQQKNDVTYYKTKAWEKNLFFAAGIKQNYPVGGDFYLYTAYSLNIKRLINVKRKIGGGIDVFYDYSDKAHFIDKGFDKPSLTYIKPALYILHDFRISRFSILIHVGTYLYAFEKNQDVGMIYDRVGVQYYFNENFSAQLALKTHYAKADCIEWAVNFSF